MGRTLTNNTSLQSAIEATPGVLPGSPAWFTHEPNGISQFGPEFNAVARRPISQNRQRRKGAIVDKDSSVEFEHDITLDAIDRFLEAFVYAEAANWDLVFRAAAATSTEFTIPAATANQAAKIQWVSSGRATLVYARGYATAANNGLKVLTADTAAAGTALTVSGLVAEASPPSGATVEVAGIRAPIGTMAIVVTQGVSAVASIAAAGSGYVVGDTLTVSGGTGTAATLRVLTISGGAVTSVAVLTRGAYTVVPSNPVSHSGGTGTGATFNLTFVPDSAVLTSAGGGNDVNFTTIGLKVGQFVHVGGLTSANQFSAGKGYGRVTALTATTLTLDKLAGTLATDPGTGETIDILFGRYFRNVPVSSNSDDTRYMERTFQFEGAYPNLEGTPGTAGYEYINGCYANDLQFNMPLTDKATATFGFVGLNTEDFVTTRKTNAASGIAPVKTVAFNTSSDFAVLQVRSATGDMGVYFKSLTLTLGNNVSGEKVLGTLGSAFVNVGQFEVDLEAQLLFTTSKIPDAIKNYDTLSFYAVLFNDDGALAIDIPSMTISGGDKEFPLDQSITINVNGEAFQDALTGTSVGISVIPATP